MVQAAQADLADSKDSVDLVEEPETLVTYSNLCLGEHSAQEAGEVVETHSVEEELVPEMSVETIWKLPSLFLSSKLPLEHHEKSQSPQW